MRFALLIALVGCAAGGEPQLSSVEDQIAIVGEELRIDLDATDPDGDRLTYRFHAPDSLGDLKPRTSLAITPGGSGVFRWTPIAADLGSHAFDFVVSDGTNESVMTINIDVVTSVTAPIFRAPIGTGTTLDFTKKDCIELDIVVEDYDTPMVMLSQQSTLGMIVQSGPMRATWKWCPTQAQRAESRHTLVLVADDGTSQSIKNFIVVLREPSAPACADDSREPDDNAMQARATAYPTYSSLANVICKADDDWYAVPLYAGEVMTVDLTFMQQNAAQDLDIHLYKSGVNLTPCDVAKPELCAFSHGQGVDSNERMPFTVPAACTSLCTYHVVVRGFDGGAAPYDISIAID